MKNILLLRWGGLGDLLVALPSIHFTRKKFPSANLILVCQKRYGEILKKTGLVDELVDGDSPELLPLFLARSGHKNTSTAWLRSFSLTLGWFSKKNTAVEDSLKLWFGGTCYLFHYEPTCREPISLHFFRQTLQAFGGQGQRCLSFEKCANLGFDLGRRGEKPVLITKENQMDKRYVVVHPGSGAQEKCWPLSHFLAMVENLGKRKTGGVLVTGEAEARLQPTLQKTALPHGWFWVHTPSLPELCQLLSGATLYLGNDSGVTHLAAACGTQALALFQRDRVIAWRPFGRTSVLSADVIEEISPEAVWKTICRLLHFS